MKKIFAMACLAISALGFSAQAVDTWDGSTDTSWERDGSNNYLIYTAEELAGLASKVKGGTDYAGVTFLLMDDLNLKGESYNWYPIGYFEGIGWGEVTHNFHYFKGTFNGQGHTITNYSANYDLGKNGSGIITVGLFGAISNATITNLAVTNSKVYTRSGCINIYGGAIVGWMENNSFITNCTSANNQITVNAAYGTGIYGGRAFAGGICGSSKNSTASGCKVAGNTTTADGKQGDNPADFSNNSSGSTIENNNKYASTDAMTTNVAAINDNTIKKNNFGVNNGETANYYLNPQTGVATDYNYYVFKGVDDSKAQTGSLRQNSTYTDGALMMPYNYNGYNYKLYPSGKVAITITFYLEGFKGNWSDAGYFIERIYNTENGADIQRNLIATYGNDGLDKDGNATYNANTDRFMRTEVYELIMPANVTSVAYTTYKIVPSSIESTAQEAVQVYGTNGALVVNAAAATELVVVSIDGRVVYNDMVEGNARIELPAGIYIANNHKVVVR